MTYATVADFLRRYSDEEAIRLTQPGRDNLDAVDTAKIEQALQDAFEEINSYRLKRGDRPPWKSSTRLKQAEIAIARKNLSNYHDQDDPRYRDYRDIVAWLRDYAADKVSLIPEDPTLPNPDDTATAHDIAWGFGSRGFGVVRYREDCCGRRWFKPQ